MSDCFSVVCPYCGEPGELYLEPDISGSLVQDCEVCCHPWMVVVSGRGNLRRVEVLRTDGHD